MTQYHGTKEFVEEHTKGRTENVKERLIREAEEGKGLGARIGKRELEYVKSLWRGENPRQQKGKAK